MKRLMFNQGVLHHGARSKVLFKCALPVAIAIAASIFTAQAGYSQERQLRTLSVSGQGMERVQTTLAEVSLGVVAEAPTAAEAQQIAAQQSDRVVSELRSQDVENLETTGITLRPVYSYERETERIVGYTASNTVKFRVDIDQAGMLMDDAVNAGATQITGIQFIAEDDAIAAAQLQALQAATRDAQAQANAVLSALGFSPEEIISIEVNNAQAPMPIRPPIPEAASLRVAQDANTPVIGGEQQVNATVTLHISY
ncbi:MAG: SIMPL domain-containing protein [Leptolyngbyaceae bacterium]|nr:SIMPL domain-containing protein [Leptolyngbyaceae bacterium]